MEIPTKEELKVINQAILTRYGLDFSHYEYNAFSRRVAKVLYKFQLKSTYHLWQKILYEDFIHEFINEVTVGLTELFRNPSLWQKIGGQILPLFKEQNQIKIWHAGCSTGEEVYTMLITLAEHDYLKKTKITATDINSNWLSVAKKGTYGKSLLEKYSKNYESFTSSHFTLKNYIEECEEGFTFKTWLKKDSLFLKHNLTHDSNIGNFDLIFCRNVLIYFDDVFKSKVLNIFHKSLNDKGLLILGYYDIFPKDDLHLFKSFSTGFKIFEKR